MPSAEINIINKLGLHARASAKLTQLAGQYPCEIFLSNSLYSSVYNSRSDLVNGILRLNRSFKKESIESLTLLFFCV